VLPRRRAAASSLPLDALPDRRPDRAGDVLAAYDDPLVLQLFAEQLVEFRAAVG